MSQYDRTIDRSWSRRAGSGRGEPPRPGVLRLFSGTEPALEAFAVGDAAITLGRGDDCDLVIQDKRLSRRHAELRFDGMLWRVRDLDSHNGTFVDGERHRQTSESGGVVGAGDTLLLLCDDLNPFLGRAVRVRDDGVVVGPRLAEAWDELTTLASSAEALHITGETGTGKELAARLFHDEGPRPKGPFVAVNCAAIPAALAERLIFGAKRGAYSGADSDSDGYIGRADGGTLFLDELAELSLEVQAKLLRVIETGELLPLGASRARKVQVRFCSATHGDLRERVSDGKFREDLYYRLCQPMISLPALRERPEEIPWIVWKTLERRGRVAHVSLVATALLRPWAGNIRELIKAVEFAAQESPGEERVRAEHLSPTAGIDPPAVEPALPDDPQSQAILKALRDHDGNVTKAAAHLKMHRTQLRRWLAKHRIPPHSATTIATGEKNR